MANEADIASELTEIHLNAAIASAQNATGNERLTGWCQNDCGEPTRGAYCSADCRNDAVKRERMGR